MLKQKSKQLHLALFLRIISSLTFVLALDVYFIVIIIYSLTSYLSTKYYIAFMGVSWVLVGICLFFLILQSIIKDINGFNTCFCCGCKCCTCTDYCQNVHIYKKVKYNNKLWLNVNRFVNCNFFFAFCFLFLPGILVYNIPCLVVSIAYFTATSIVKVIIRSIFTYSTYKQWDELDLAKIKIVQRDGWNQIVQ